VLIALCALCGIFAAAPFSVALARDPPPPTITLAELPPEGRATLELIHQRGPFPYQRDGVVFGNFERRLPIRERGYYREYTVVTPGLSHRGARRIVVGRQGELYYTADHYRSFRRIVE
jgi:ribonuclease T1